MSTFASPLHISNIPHGSSPNPFAIPIWSRVVSGNTKTFPQPMIIPKSRCRLDHIPSTRSKSSRPSCAPLMFRWWLRISHLGRSNQHTSRPAVHLSGPDLATVLTNLLDGAPLTEGILESDRGTVI